MAGRVAFRALGHRDVDVVAALVADQRHRRRRWHGGGGAHWWIGRAPQL